MFAQAAGRTEQNNDFIHKEPNSCFIARLGQRSCLRCQHRSLSQTPPEKRESKGPGQRQKNRQKQCIKGINIPICLNAGNLFRQFPAGPFHPAAPANQCPQTSKKDKIYNPFRTEIQPESRHNLPPAMRLNPLPQHRQNQSKVIRTKQRKIFDPKTILVNKTLITTNRAYQGPFLNVQMGQCGQIFHCIAGQTLQELPLFLKQPDSLLKNHRIIRGRRRQTCLQQPLSRLRLQVTQCRPLLVILAPLQLKSSTFIHPLSNLLLVLPQIRQVIFLCKQQNTQSTGHLAGMGNLCLNIVKIFADLSQFRLNGEGVIGSLLNLMNSFRLKPCQLRIFERQLANNRMRPFGQPSSLLGAGLNLFYLLQARLLNGLFPKTESTLRCCQLPRG